MGNKVDLERLKLDTASLLRDKPWYSDLDGSLIKAREILVLVEQFCKDNGIYQIGELPTIEHEMMLGDYLKEVRLVDG